MYHYLSVFSCLVLLIGFFFVAPACDNPECSVNSQCGSTHLCRSNECVPKCQTYKTCAEGEACIDGACETPPADYCSDIAPSLAPEMGVYAPCPPSQSDDMGMEGNGEANEESNEEEMNME